MLMSMTGFASKSVAISLENGAQSTVTVNVKSLNSRYFETTFKMPHYVSSLETDLLQILKAKLKRGHIFYTLNLSTSHIAKGAVEPSFDVIQSYLSAIQKVQDKFHISGAISISELIQLPNVFLFEEKNIDDQVKSTVVSLTQEAIVELIQARTKEGEAMLADMEQRCALMEKEIIEIERVSEKIMLTRKEEITKELHELSGEATEAQRMMLYSELDKIDIHEEIVRFKSHLQNIKSLLSSAELEKGKRIDFTVQELAREINTIAAKCSDVTIGSRAINIKVELEKIREQAQNIV